MIECKENEENEVDTEEEYDYLNEEPLIDEEESFEYDEEEPDHCD